MYSFSFSFFLIFFLNFPTVQQGGQVILTCIHYNYIFSPTLSSVFFFVFCLFMAAPKAYGGSQARGLIGAIAAGLHHSHSNSGSEPSLGPTPQLVATLDP